MTKKSQNKYLHILEDKFCHKLGFSATRWARHNTRERVMKTLVHFSSTKRTPTQINGFIQFDFFSFHTTNPIFMKVK